jgi:hypothetical protein
MSYYCERDGLVPDWFLIEWRNGGIVQVKTAIGWVTLADEEVEFRNGLHYRVFQ